MRGNVFNVYRGTNKKSISSHASVGLFGVAPSSIVCGAPPSPLYTSAEDSLVGRLSDRRKISIEDMARSHVAVALTSALLGVLLVLQLYCQYKIPGLDYEFEFGPGPTNPSRSDAPKAPLKPPLPEITKLDRDEYLLGVGKADITG